MLRSHIVLGLLSRLPQPPGKAMTRRARTDAHSRRAIRAMVVPVCRCAMSGEGLSGLCVRPLRWVMSEWRARAALAWHVVSAAQRLQRSTAAAAHRLPVCSPKQAVVSLLTGDGSSLTAYELG